MNRSDTLREGIEALAEAHQGDRDGVYLLVDALLGWLRSLDAEERPRFVETLLGFVRERHPRLAGAALETLARSGESDAARGLVETLHWREDWGEWEAEIMRTILRLGDPTIVYEYRAYVGAALDRGEMAALPLLGALYQADYASALAIAARFFGEALAGREREDAERRVLGFIPGQVAALASHGPGAVRKLIERTGEERPESGEVLRSLILGYLDQPWAADRFGPDTLDDLRDAAGSAWIAHRVAV